MSFLVRFHLVVDIIAIGVVRIILLVTLRSNGDIRSVRPFTPLAANLKLALRDDGVKRLGPRLAMYVFNQDGEDLDVVSEILWRKRGHAGYLPD